MHIYTRPGLTTYFECKCSLFVIDKQFSQLTLLLNHFWYCFIGIARKTLHASTGITYTITSKTNQEESSLESKLECKLEFKLKSKLNNLLFSLNSSLHYSLLFIKSKLQSKQESKLRK